MKSGKTREIKGKVPFFFLFGWQKPENSQNLLVSIFIGTELVKHKERLDKEDDNGWSIWFHIYNSALERYVYAELLQE